VAPSSQGLSFDGIDKQFAEIVNKLDKLAADAVKEVDARRQANDLSGAGQALVKAEVAFSP